MQTLHTSKPADNLRPHARTPASRFGRTMLLAGGFISVALIAAACSSGGTSKLFGKLPDIAQGLSAQSAGHTQQAIDDFNAAAKASPTNPIPYYDLGVIYQQYLKDPANAAAEYNKAILANSGYKAAIYNLAILDTPANPQAAISLYQELVKLNPNDSNVLFNLGLLLHANGQATEGQTDISKAVLINPALSKRIPANSGITP